VLRIFVDIDYEAECIHVRQTPEHKLLLAILMRALGDLHSNQRFIVRETIQWFTARDRKLKYWNGFTFNQIIDELEFSPYIVALFKEIVDKVLYDKCMSERKESRKKLNELAERTRSYFSPQKCAALRAAL
jgi:hypothetical protein